MSQTTIHTVYGEDLGEAANHHDLVPFYDLFQEAADEDPRVRSYGCEEITNSDHEPIAYRITLCGTVTAQDFANEVYEGKHGSW
jgi:hypothetical protein